MPTHPQGAGATTQPLQPLRPADRASAAASRSGHRSVRGPRRPPPLRCPARLAVLHTPGSAPPPSSHRFGDHERSGRRHSARPPAAPGSRRDGLSRLGLAQQPQEAALAPHRVAPSVPTSQTSHPLGFGASTRPAGAENRHDHQGGPVASSAGTPCGCPPLPEAPLPRALAQGPSADLKVSPDLLLRFRSSSSWLSGGMSLWREEAQ